MRGFCGLCHRLDGRLEKEELEAEEQRRAHIHCHQRQLQLVSGRKVSVQELFDACFSSNSGKVQAGVRLRKLCQDLYQKNGMEDSMYCSECRRGLRCIYTGAKTFVPAALINHAYAHLDKPLLVCRICKYKAATIYGIRKHASTTHGLKSSLGSFEDHRSNHIDDVVDILEKCFRRPKSKFNSGTASRKVLVNKTATENMARSACRANATATYCRELVKRFMQNSGKIRCRLCSRHIAVSTKQGINNFFALNHALVHLKAPIYHCRLCQSVQHTKASMNFHTKSVHGLTANGNYDDRSAEYNSEILAMVSKCFDWSEETSKA